MRVLWILIPSLLCFGLGCKKQNGIQIDEASLVYPMDSSALALTPPRDQNSPNFQFESLSWEAAKPATVKWSNYLFNLIDQQEFEILDRATDATTFCPKYESLSRLQKINFWGALISGMTRFESNYRPTTRMVEYGLGNDVVTGRPTASEGLLQLSYSDSRYRSFCKMNWNVDRYKTDTDPTKTIFDPYVNLECGLKILSDQILDQAKIAVTSGAYWSVLKVGHSNQKIAPITEITKQLSFCD